MKYFSTRGGSERLSFEEAVLTGLAPNGGLYIPEHIPQLPNGWKESWKDYSFVQLSVAVLSLYISPDEISPQELHDLVSKSYATFTHPDVTPIVPLDDGGDRFVLELFHGPTFAFKDVALQLLGNLFEFFLSRRNARKQPGEPREKLTIVGATSGDTGSAAIYGVRNKPDISIFILFPHGRVSPVQEAQMTTVLDANVHNLAVHGTFDDCQDLVKTLFADTPFNAAHRLGAVNSINWARILAQTVYYFLAYFHVDEALRAQGKKGLGTSEGEREVQFVVPTGNFGDVLAGFYAQRMGLPMAKLGVATNANDILYRFWKSGRYEKVDSSSSSPQNGTATAPADGASDGKQASSTGGGVKETLSPAMDILVSSNFERLLWYLAFAASPDSDDAARREKASATIADWMARVKSDGRVEVPTAILNAARADFVAGRADDAQITRTIQRTYDTPPAHYVADPHTAVALHVASEIERPQNTTQIVLSTAHPAKFSSAVTQALVDDPSRSAAAAGTKPFDFDAVLPPAFRGLLDKERRVEEVAAPQIELVKAVIERFAVKEDVSGKPPTGSV
ncbi:threonine synthase [Coniophora puteana RWD-64-598 SS2]|uniref:threonine synthase n=1 Tax=Coniophora puteana (strain RWD-64-598) TaxID=741705 RepID=A0A5M3MKJ2_CONPW|nr:threonine synthase [Coniophora puteana RWD-64-598 SS2]EIW79749.1 threonine synthase [Coniophora puteana RWD-64-598 SS2]